MDAFNHHALEVLLMDYGHHEDEHYELDQVGHGEELDLNGNLITAISVEWECYEQDTSFDYAGTHCTGGRSGTHKCSEPAIRGVHVLGYWYEVYEGREVFRPRNAIPRSRLEYYEEIVQDILERDL